MTGRERCDEILRLIDEVLADCDRGADSSRGGQDRRLRVPGPQNR